MNTGRDLSDTSGYLAEDFKHTDDNGNETWDYKHVADTIEEIESFKYLSEDDTDQLFVQEDGIWKEKGESTVTNLCMELTNEGMFSQRAIKNVKQLIKNRNRIYKESNFFEPPKRLVPFKNGVYDVEKDEFRDYTEDDNFRFKHNVDFIENPEEKDDNGKVEKFLDSIQNNDRKKEILKEVTGLALLPDFPIDKAPVLFGSGSNGKNKFVEMVDKISGTYHEIDLNEYTDDKFASAELENTTMAFFDEFQHIKDPSKVKNFIGSEKIRVRHMNQEGYMAKQIALPILAANELPTPPEQRTSFFRRWEIIDFPYEFTAVENDGNKDMMSDEELKQQYWTDEALSCFASKAVRKLGALIKRQDYYKGQTPDEVKHIWNHKSNPVYTFLDYFIEQGKLPNQGTTDSADKIVKEKLLGIVNDYLDIVNGGEVQMGQLTHALKTTNEVEIGNHADVDVIGGRTKKAYTGVRLTLPDLHDFNQSNQPDNSGIMTIIRDHWQAFSDLASNKGAHIPEIAQTDLESKTLKFLDYQDNRTASLLEVIKALDLDEEEIEEVRDYEFINLVSNDGKIQRFPNIEMDVEAFDNAVEESDNLVKDEQSYKRPSRWLQDKIDDLTQNQQVNVDDYFIDPGKDKGFSEDKLEDAFEKKIDEEEIYEPKPGKVEVL